MRRSRSGARDRKPRRCIRAQSRQGLIATGAASAALRSGPDARTIGLRGDASGRDAPDPSRHRRPHRAALLVAIGLVLAVGFGRAWRGDLAGATAPWWAYLFLMLLAVAMLALAAAVSIDPRPLQLRQALGGAALVWLIVLVVIAIGAAGASRTTREAWLLVILAVVVSAALADLAVTTRVVAGPAGEIGLFQRLGAVIVFAVAILMAAGAAVIVVSLARAVWRRDRPGRAGRPPAVGSRRGDRGPATRHVRDRGDRHAARGRRHVPRSGVREPAQQRPAHHHPGRDRGRDRRDHRGHPHLRSGARPVGRRGRGPRRARCGGGAHRFGSDVILQTAGARLADPDARHGAPRRRPRAVDRREPPGAARLHHRRRQPERVRDRARPGARVRGGHDRPARADGSRGAPGRHRARARATSATSTPATRCTSRSSSASSRS